MKFLEKIIELFFPTKCAICGKLGKNICDKCYEDIKKYEIKNQHKDLFFIYKYEGIIRNSLINYKFNNKPYLYRFFSESLTKNKKVCQFLNCYDIIIPVPLHKKRYNERGYNQSEVIAKELSKNNKKVKFYNNILIKKVNTKPQSTKGIKERIEDIKDIYEVKNETIIKEKRILIFDDIYTTGSTTNECKKVLLNAGAKNVGIMAIAKDYIL